MSDRGPVRPDKPCPVMHVVVRFADVRCSFDLGACPGRGALNRGGESVGVPVSGVPGGVPCMGVHAPQGMPDPRFPWVFQVITTLTCVPQVVTLPARVPQVIPAPTRVFQVVAMFPGVTEGWMPPRMCQVVPASAGATYPVMNVHATVRVFPAAHPG